MSALVLKVCVSARCIYSFPYRKKEKKNILWNGESMLPSNCPYPGQPGYIHLLACDPAFSHIFPLVIYLYPWADRPHLFINSCHQASLRSARLSLKCKLCTQASSSYVFLLFWSFCFPAGQLRQFWPAWPVAGHFQPLPILSPNNLQYIRWGGREESANSLLHISIPELPSHIFLQSPWLLNFADPFS